MDNATHGSVFRVHFAMLHRLLCIIPELDLSGHARQMADERLHRDRLMSVLAEADLDAAAPPPPIPGMWSIVGEMFDPRIRQSCKIQQV
jgi:hypothetical protein